jgi:hypothetical protein
VGVRAKNATNSIYQGSASANISAMDEGQSNLARMW